MLIYNSSFLLRLNVCNDPGESHEGVGRKKKMTVEHMQSLLELCWRQPSIRRFYMAALAF